MKRAVVLRITACLVCLAVIAGQAMAGTVTFSNRTWTTLDSLADGQYEPDQWSGYSAAGNTGIMTGRFGVDSAMTTSFTLNVGDKVSYDYHLTELPRDFGGDGGTYPWVGDSRTGFQDASGGWITGRVATYNSRWEQYFEGSNPGYIYQPRSLDQSTHIEWLFDTATSATVTLTLDGETTPYATWTDTFSSIADITTFRVGLWDSEQDVTLSNFSITSVPEPSSLVGLALGASSLLAIRRRRR